jgi:uncharacterized protein YecT (DUF1311 family)
MPSIPQFRIIDKRLCVTLFSMLALALLCAVAPGRSAAQETPSPSQAPQSTQLPPQQPMPPPAEPQPGPLPPPPPYDAAMFLKPIPKDQLTFLTQFDGAPAKELYRDKQFHKLMKSFVPDCLFHYGKDMSLSDALEMVMKDSRIPVQIRDGRYLLISGLGGPYLAGRGFMWLDMQDGIGLGGFYFHPTNGEPTPTTAVFSRQVKAEPLTFSELPPAFINDMIQWSTVANVPPLSTTYFLTGSNRRVLLEHDEDFCSRADGTVAPAGDVCEQMNADAADVDMNAAYYLDQVHYATNATAWMLGPDQIEWIGIRDHTCGVLANPMGCRIRMARERTHVILRRGGGSHPGPHH